MLDHSRRNTSLSCLDDGCNKLLSNVLRCERLGHYLIFDSLNTRCDHLDKGFVLYADCESGERQEAARLIVIR